MGYTYTIPDRCPEAGRSASIGEAVTRQLTDCLVGYVAFASVTTLLFGINIRERRELTSEEL